MNNEEKIIGMLEQVIQKVDGLEHKVDGLEREVRDVKQNVARIEVDHGQKLDALFDGYKMLSEKIDRLSLVEAQEDDMAIMKAAIKHLSAEITEIKKAM